VAPASSVIHPNIMDKSKAAMETLERQRRALWNLPSRGLEDVRFTKWRRDTELAIEFVFGKATRHLADFSNISWTPRSPDPAWNEAFVKGRQEASTLLKSMIHEINENWSDKVLV
jgi:hypothetical protein